MKATILNVAQRSPEWYAARCGRLTGSVAADMLAMTNKGESAYRVKLRRRLVAERLTRIADDELQFVSKEMQRGIDLEPMAFAAYEGLTGRPVRRVGFLLREDFDAGCSPDGYVGSYEGLIELKCPKSTTHLEYIQAGVIPEDYLPQLRHNLWVSGAAWIDFVSFDDRFTDPAHQLFVRRLMRDAADLKTYEDAALAFLAEVKRDLAALVQPAAEAAVAV